MLMRRMKQETFRAEFESQRQKLVDAAMGLLAQNVGKGVETLVGLLDAGDGRLKRLAARHILDQHVEFRELDDLTRRIEAIEERLEER